MKYMICRKDAVERNIRTSEMFPGIIEASPDETRESVLLRYLNDHFPGYVGKYAYYVVPMDEAVIVTFRKKQEYDVFIEPA
jgi:hypothetical protein